MSKSISELYGWESNLYTGNVDGGELLGSIVKIIDEHLVVPDGASIAIGLFIFNTYLFECGNFLPKLLISSPVKGCGKTTAQNIIAMLANRSLPTSNITPAMIYRAIEMHSPTLIIDEADTFLNNNEEVYGILNAGHSKLNAYVIRGTGNNFEPTMFRVFAPQVIGMIGHPKNEALYSRCIVINMIRRAPDEVIKNFNPNDHIWGKLKGRLAKWATDNKELLLAQEVVRLKSGDDRKDDNWEPLLGIAKLCGEQWLARAIEAANKLDHCELEEDLGPMLLRDIQAIFTSIGADRITSKNLIGKLKSLEDRPWKGFIEGKHFNERSLSKLLKPFSISPKTVRVSEGTFKGYMLDQFEDTFRRYLR